MSGIASRGEQNTSAEQTTSSAFLAMISTASNTLTLIANKILSLTTADSLLIGGIIVPQTMIVTRTLSATDLSQTIFTAPFACQVIGVSAVWGVAGGAAAVVNVEKLTGTTAPGSGNTVQASTVDITATANTVTNPTLSSTTADLQLAVGNRLGVKLGGVLTGLLGCVITVHLKRI